MPFSAKTPRVGQVVNVVIGGVIEFEAAVKNRVLNCGQNIVILDVPSATSCHLPTELVLCLDGTWAIYKPQNPPQSGRIFIQPVN